MVALRFSTCLRFLGCIVLLAPTFAFIPQFGWPNLYYDMRAHASTLFDDLCKLSGHRSPPCPAAPVPREEVGDCFNFTSPALNHYQVLDLPIDAPHEWIQPAYEKLVRVCHPDKLKESTVSPEAAIENYARLRLAYAILKCQSSRCLYNCDMMFSRCLQRTKEQKLLCLRCATLRAECGWEY